VDLSGDIIQSYGSFHGSAVEQLCYPWHLTVDAQDNLLVADGFNNRVLLLRSTLTYVSVIVIPGHMLDHPYTPYFDELKSHMYIGEYDGGEGLFVLQVLKNLDDEVTKISLLYMYTGRICTLAEYKNIQQ